MARRRTGNRTITVYGGEGHSISDLYDAAALGYTINLIPGGAEMKIQVGTKWFSGDPDVVIEEVLDYVS